MVVLAILVSGQHCIGTLQEDGSLIDAYYLLFQPPPQGAQGVGIALLSPFHPLDNDTAVKHIDSKFIMITRPALKDLCDVYQTKVSGIIMAKPLDVQMVNKNTGGK